MRLKPPLRKLRCQVRREVLGPAKLGRAVRSMFQDEGRFGLLGTPRRCLAPHPARTVVGARVQRQSLDTFSAVSPHDGLLDFLVLPWITPR